MTLAPPTRIVRTVARRRSTRLARAGRRRYHGDHAGRARQPSRFLTDTTGDGRADIVGFGNDGVWVSRTLADGTYGTPGMVMASFGYNAGGWRVDQHPRFVADATGDGRADIIGFGNTGVWIVRS
jgi:hypothetical protein